MKKVRPLLFVAAFSLLLTSCFDTKNPLSDPQKSKADDRLAGVWRFRGDGGEMNYYHIGHVGEKFPASVMQVVFVQHMTDGRVESDKLLIFPTTIGGKTYLNVAEYMAPNSSNGGERLDERDSQCVSDSPVSDHRGRTHRPVDR